MPQDNMSHRIELSDKATNLFISLKGAYSKSNGGKGQAAAKAVAQAATQAAAQALAKAAKAAKAAAEAAVEAAAEAEALFLCLLSPSCWG